MLQKNEKNNKDKLQNIDFTLIDYNEDKNKFKLFKPTLNVFTLFYYKSLRFKTITLTLGFFSGILVMNVMIFKIESLGIQIYYTSLYTSLGLILAVILMPFAY